MLIAICFLVSRALAQTNMPTNAMEWYAEPGVSSAPNIVWAMYGQVVNNPASLMVIWVLCVLAWLFDDCPWINSKYVAHLTVVIGGSIYWMFAGPSTVPKTFPYSMPVLVSNGIICGFIAFVIHKQVVHRIIQFVRARSPKL